MAKARRKSMSMKVLWHIRAEATDKVYPVEPAVVLGDGREIYAASVGRAYIVPTDISIWQKPDGSVRWTGWMTPYFRAAKEEPLAKVLHTLESNAEYYSAITEGEQ